MISILYVIAAFGGGIFAAAIGGVPAFILTGVFSIIGSAAGMCGAEQASDILLNYFAFGPFFGPHIAFAGAVAGSAFAKKKGLLENGADIITPLAGLNDASVLLMGGVFGVIGCLFKELVIANVFAGTISNRLVTDTPGITVFFSAILVRLVFGGKMRTGTEVMSKGKALTATLTIGAGYSIMIGGLFTSAVAAGFPVEVFGGCYPQMIFGIAAIGLVFGTMGHAYYGCHHIVIIAAEAALQSYANTGNLYIALLISVIFGTISALICDVEGKLINSGKDSHIDGPACAIFIMTFVINACFPV